MTPAETLIRSATAAPVEPDGAPEDSRQAVLAGALAVLQEHSPLTANHSKDVVVLCEAIARRLGISGAERDRLLAAAEVHDIGKVAIPSSIIDKPGPLDDREWEVVHDHTVEGERILESIPALVEVARIVRFCHERWDGGGYPDGLSGEQIPLTARVVFCADAFHAMRCDRPYRRGRSAEEALDEIRANAGTQFDPRVAEALIEAARELRYSRPARVRALSIGGRSGRVLALLLTLAIAGSASAATRVGPLHSLLHRGGDGQGTAAGTGERFATGSGAEASGAARSTNVAEQARQRRAAARERRRGKAGTGSGQEGPGLGQGVHAGGSQGSASDPGRSGAAPGRSLSGRKQSPPRTGRPVSPGRSGEAPGRPAVPGRPPPAPGPGRSGEAPGPPAPSSAAPHGAGATHH